MKAGDVCRCISDFSGISAEELTLYKNDIIQIISVVDRHWVEAEGGGSVGRVPSSVLVTVDLPPHPPDLPLFVASSEFMPSQGGDLGLARGDFVIGLNEIDESWWCGELHGKKGIFPRNFVWPINEDIIEVEDKSERPVRMKGRVNMSIRAQLPEELNLYSGDIVNITHIVDKDWYRGESNGETGIFPSNFVNIMEEDSMPSPAVEGNNFTQLSGTVQHSTPVSSTIPSRESSQPATPQSVVTPSVSSLITSVSSLGYVAPTTLDSPLTPSSTSSTPHSGGRLTNSPVPPLSNISSHWKTIDCDDEDLFDDDYFKQNMPGLYSSTKGGNKPTSSANSTSAANHSPLTKASASPSYCSSVFRYENISDITASADIVNQDAIHGINEIPQHDKNSLSRYEAIPEANVLPGSNKYLDDDDAHGREPETSAFTSVQETGNNNMLNSLSQRVDEYFSQNLLDSKDVTAPLLMNNNNLAKDYNILSSLGYNENNTGIEPYGRAVFSFRAQYPNELTFKKGDIIRLLKHVDSHWTLGQVGDNMGIFPSSYVDIIVDCLHNEEELFLSRPEAATKKPYLGHAKATYDFPGVQAGDVSMMKGDILKILKHVDNNWLIVKNTTGSEGMCPKNYLQVIVESSKVYATQLSDPGSESGSERKPRLPAQESVHERSRSSSPFNSSGKRRSYNKEDFGSIKEQDVEPILAKNMASLDLTIKSVDKKSSESIFTEREISKSTSDHVHMIKRQKRPVSDPILHTQQINDVILDNFDCIASNPETPSNPQMAPKLSHIPQPPQVKPEPQVLKPQHPVAAPRNVKPSIPPRTKLSRKDSSTSIETTSPTVTSAGSPSYNLPMSAGTSSGAPIPSPVALIPSPVAPVPTAMPRSESSKSTIEVAKTSEPIYARVQKPQLMDKPSLSQPHKREDKEPAASAPSLPRGDSVGSATFPEDVCHMASDGPYLSETTINTTSSGLVPQRPAPPPPPKVSQDFYDEVEEYYSLPPRDSKMQSEQISRQEEASEARYENIAFESDDGEDQQTTSTVEEPLASQSAETTTDRDGKNSRSRVNHRRELVKEIVSTEHEFIHDLEALIQVTHLASTQKEAQTVDVEALMGNINQVVNVAKKLATQLDRVAYKADEEMLVGEAFLFCADELCEVHKVYCSNHNVTAEPLMKKYADEAEPTIFLQWVLSELQQHKIQLLDMRSVLIKPVQRILKYPLFLDRLVNETDEDHPDYTGLLRANTKMADVAKEINEYTKRLDLVNKYRFESDQSLQSKMQRLSLHSVVKKSARISTHFSKKLGIMSQTKDPEFDEEVAKLRCLQKWVSAMAHDVEVLVQSIKARHTAELEIAKGLADIFLESACKPELEALQRTVLDSCNRHFENFENFVKQRVIMPTKQLLILCDIPEPLILKRHDKRLDYDSAQYKLDRNKDPARTRILEEELSHMKGTYEALNTQLMMDLPVLIKSGTEVMLLCSRSLVAARMYLQGRLAQSFLNLAQVPGLSYCGEEDMLAQFRVKYLQQMGEFRQLSFIPADSLQRTLSCTRARTRKSLDNTAKKEENMKKKVLGKYPGAVVYVVTEVHTPVEVMELTLYPGDHVALLKNKDPLGSSDRWFVDDGDNKGFVRASSLKPLQDQEGRAGIQTVLPSATSSTVPLPAPLTSTAPPRPSTMPRAAPPPPLPERPPRYEDLFPSDASGRGAAVHTQVPSYRGSGEQVPPPKYSPELTPTTTTLAQPPLPSKPGHHHYSPVEDSDYYTPPPDRQQSNEYNSPVSEEHNIYEEIGQGGLRTKECEESEGVDSSPIYEVIHDGELVRNSSSHPTTQPTSHPTTQPTSHPTTQPTSHPTTQPTSHPTTQPTSHPTTQPTSHLDPSLQCHQPQFYYAQYNFGGSDGTQLNLVAGQVVMVVHVDESSEWWFVEDRHANQGYVPASYLTRYS